MAKVNLDKLQATTNGNIENVVSDIDLPNGSMISLGAKVAGQFELISAIAPSATAEALLVAAPEVKYEDSITSSEELDYTTRAGKAVRAYHLTVGDKFQVEQTLFAVAPAVGDVVTASANFGYEVGTGQTTFVVEELTGLGFDKRPAVLLRVLSV